MRPPDRDLAHCHALLARGSRSFSFAARLLPARLSDPVAALYAFCRVSDDLVDESADPRGALEQLALRVDRVYAGRPDDDAVDRALAWLADDHALPRAPIDALLDGYRWDVEQREYQTLSDLVAYAVRVAGSVGVAMSWLMDRRAPHVLARACDLGVAMQLTNVARDVGEDARNGRLYLPRAWLDMDDATRAAFLAEPFADAGVRDATRRLLDHADVLYARADAGIDALPGEVRPAIRVASALYAAIGEVVRAHDHDSVGARAVTTTPDKIGLAVGALARHRRR
ncbi:MAG: phytoene/squalene synthase family protein, partial [Deltaproteobacteria bacterium]|nr:phytoene/squalene synthase family protein [Deltaproteobacteria bacterium]